MGDVFQNQPRPTVIPFPLSTQEAGEGQPAPPHNLPAALTRFVGREAELAALERLLGNERLVSLVGPGGVGKTRLALQAAWQALKERPEQFPEGICFVSLSVVQSADVLVFAIAEALQAPYFGGADLKQQLIGFLRPRRMLLVLDNFEQLAAFGGLLVELLQQAPEVKALVTTRERLNVYGEAVLVVGGLSLPPTEDLPAMQAAQAVQLFVQSAQRGCPDFVLAQENSQAVLRICRQVEGLPLALEMAGAWMRTLMAEEVVRAIESDLSFLEAHWPEIPARQRSMRAILEHSWSLLSAQEQQTFLRLAIFEGSFWREAAEKVTGASLATLAALGDKSFLHWNSRQGWYEIHPLLKRLATEKLAEQPEEAARLGELHSRFFMEYLRQREEALHGAGQGQALREISQASGNVRQAWQWAVRQGALALVEQGVEGLYLFYEARSLFEEAEEMFAQTVEVLQAAGAVSVPLVWKLRARQAALLYRLGQAAEALEILQRCLEGADGVHPPDEPHPPDALADGERIFCLIKLGGVLVFKGQADQAQEHLERALALAQRGGLAWAEAESLYVLGRIAGRQGKLKEAGDHFSASSRLYQQIGDRRGVALCTQAVGMTLIDRGEHQRAVGCYLEALEIFRAIGDLFWEGVMYDNLGHAAGEQGQYAQSRRYREQALQAARQVGDRVGEARALSNLGNTQMYLGDYAGAQTYIEQALPIFRAIGRTLGEAIALNNLALLKLGQGEPGPARHYAQQSLEMLRPLKDSMYDAYALMALGQAQAALGELEAAEQAFQQCYALRQALEMPHLVAEALAGLAQVALAQGQLSQARAHIEPVAQFLQGKLPAGTDAFYIYLVCYQVLCAAQDGRAAGLLRRGVALLQERAARIVDEDARRMYLENVPYQRQLLEAYGELEAQAKEGEQAAAAGLVEPLTRQEFEILRLLAEGLSNQAIAGRLTVAVGTVKFHVHNVYGKLGVSSRTQAIAQGRASKLV
jgi:predicted ATPase/DNA-binding CsgD family transcriptional regulator